MKRTVFVTLFLGISLGPSCEGQTRPSTPPQITSTSPQLEEREQPVTVDDVAILVRAEALLNSASVWNRADDRECTDDEATGKRSLFCALQKACIDVLGSYDHRRVALQEVRFAVEEPREDAISRIVSGTSTIFRKRDSTTSGESWP